MKGIYGSEAALVAVMGQPQDSLDCFIRLCAALVVNAHGRLTVATRRLNRGPIRCQEW
jgi:hypothetical protein